MRITTAQTVAKKIKDSFENLTLVDDYEIRVRDFHKEVPVMFSKTSVNRACVEVIDTDCKMQMVSSVVIRACIESGESSGCTSFYIDLTDANELKINIF